MKTDDINVLSQTVKDWLDSQGGEEALKRAVNEAKEATSRLEEARQVDVEDLHRHFTL